MKKLQIISALTLAFLIICSGMNAYSSETADKNVQGDTLIIKTYRGIVKDAESNDILPFATVEAAGTNVATVTNIDGEFTIKIANNSGVSGLKFSYIGYSNRVVSLSEFEENKERDVELAPVAARIKELTIRPVYGPEFMAEVLRKVSENYNTEPQMMTGFYRETIKNRRNYVSISEAVVDIYKSGYKNTLQIDQVKIDKGRKSADVEKMDTILFKLQGGPTVSLLLDVVKNPYILLTEEYAKVYNFTLENVISLDDRLHYVVEFKQKPYIKDPYYYGRLFIDMDKLAISEAEFSLNTENEDQAARFFIEKKPVGMNLIPEKATYRSSYTIQDDHWYFNYARAEVKFIVDWDKKLFNDVYTIMSEIAITDRRTGSAEKINFKERFKRHDILDEMVYVYFDPEYWGDYNVIEPDQSIESAIRKLNRKFERR
ncbi:MAG: carboxypeptidase-like regulatory domain-containing protein [Bacteroidales bacterium]